MGTELMDRLEAALEKTDLDQGQAARVLGTSPRTVSRWLNDEVKPRAESGSDCWSSCRP